MKTGVPLAAMLLLASSAQESPLLDIQRAPNGVELRWRSPAGAAASRLPSFQLEGHDAQFYFC